MPGPWDYADRMLMTRLPRTGMVHLHSLNPPLIHMNFSTMKVLLGEDLTPKVADAGIRSLLNRVDGAASSPRMSEDDPFLDPE